MSPFFSVKLLPYDHIQDAQLYFWRVYRERYGGLINERLSVPMREFMKMRRVHGQMHDGPRRRRTS